MLIAKDIVVQNVLSGLVTPVILKSTTDVFFQVPAVAEQQAKILVKHNVEQHMKEIN